MADEDLGARVRAEIGDVTLDKLEESGRRSAANSAAVTGPARSHPHRQGFGLVG